MTEMGILNGIDYDALSGAARAFDTALQALNLAMTDHRGDVYLQRQAREHVWTSYWALRAAANDSPKPQPKSDESERTNDG